MLFAELSIIILIILSAFFSGSETALFSLSRARVRRMRNSGSRSGRAVADLLAVPRKLLNTILIGNLVVNTLLSSILALLFRERFGPEGIGIAMGVTTVLLLIFGEITPKILGIHRAEAFGRFASLPLKFFSYVFTPVRYVVRYTSNGILSLIRQPSLEHDTLLTREAFRSTLIAGKIQGGIAPNEAEIIHAISSFRTTIAREIMIPRPEMNCVHDGLTLAEALRASKRTRSVRLPVYHKNIDHITGVLDCKLISAWRHLITFNTSLHDLALLCADQQNPPALPFLIPPYIIPEMRQIDSLLVEMHERGEELAILLDEYGGTAGMITRSMIIETLLGGIIDMKSGKSLIHVRPNGDIIAAGRTRVSQLNWECNIHLPQDCDDTLAGYILRSLGALPEPGQTLSRPPYEFTILQMTGPRIDAVRIRQLQESQV